MGWRPAACRLRGAFFMGRRAARRRGGLPACSRTAALRRPAFVCAQSPDRSAPTGCHPARSRRIHLSRPRRLRPAWILRLRCAPRRMTGSSCAG